LNFAAALAVAVIFGAGAYIILQRNLVRIVVGIILISNSANLFIVAAGITQGEPPIYPLSGGEVSDPLVQAMALTAIVINSSITALLLGLVYRLYMAHGSIDIEDVSSAEVQEAELLEREDGPEREGF
jgi:multicomponent Na+:H+ antiporter subunit C